MAHQTLPGTQFLLSQFPSDILHKPLCSHLAQVKSDLIRVEVLLFPQQIHQSVAARFSIGVLHPDRSD